MDQVDLITKALGYTENNGKPDLNNTKPGQTGEVKSIFQFLPETWQQYSTEAFKKPVPVTNDNEVVVVKHKVAQWIDEDKKAGIPDDQIPLRIASRWNSNDPEAYKGKFTTGKRKGAAARGPSSKNPKVIFDVPKYVNNFKQHYTKLSRETGINNQAGQQITSPQMAKTTQPIDQSSPAREVLMNMLSSTATVPPINPETPSTKTSKGGLLQGLLLGKGSL